MSFRFFLSLNKFIESINNKTHLTQSKRNNLRKINILKQKIFEFFGAFKITTFFKNKISINGKVL